MNTMKRARRSITIFILGLLLTAGFAFQASAAAKQISQTKAKKIALKDAGAKQSAVKQLRIEKEKERGVAVYEVNFCTNKHEYEYDIRRTDGKIIGKEVEVLSKNAGSCPVTPSGPIITKSRAKKLILAHAVKKTGKKLTGSKIKPKYDLDDGVPVYEVEFKEKNISFEYEIHARTEKILEYSIEWPAK